MEQKGVQRKNWIDAAKTIAILIVVLNHSGLVIPGVNFWGGMFYVPAFFLLAGYTYRMKDEGYKSFVKRKAARLLVPYFITNALLFLFFQAKDVLTKSFRPTGAVSSLLGIFYGRTRFLKEGDGFIIYRAPIPDINLMPNLNAPTWFLPALFLVLVCGEGLLRLMKGNKKKVNLFVAVFAFLMLVYHYLSPFLLPWCLDILPYLLAFFLIGYELKDRQGFEWLEKAKALVKWKITGGILVAAVGSSLLNGSSNLSLSYFGKTVAGSMISAVSTSILLLLVLRRLDKSAPKVTEFLGRMSGYTLTILCWHYFVMQMFYSGLWVLLPDAGEASGAVKVFIQLGGIVVSITACVLLKSACRRISGHRNTKD